jgi:hypothetical protein
MFPIRRTQTVTLRLDPKLRYLTDLAARSQRRTTSGFIEWAIEGSFSEVPVYSESGGVVLLAEIDNYLWDVDESDRFLKTCFCLPKLTYTQRADNLETYLLIYYSGGSVKVI